MELYGPPVDPYGSLWTPMGFYGGLSIPMDPYRALWRPTEPCGTCGYLWSLGTPTEHYESLWALADPYRPLLGLLV